MQKTAVCRPATSQCSPLRKGRSVCRPPNPIGVEEEVRYEKPIARFYHIPPSDFLQIHIFQDQCHSRRNQPPYLAWTFRPQFSTLGASPSPPSSKKLTCFFRSQHTALNPQHENSAPSTTPIAFGSACQASPPLLVSIYSSTLWVSLFSPRADQPKFCDLGLKSRNIDRATSISLHCMRLSLHHFCQMCNI